MRLNNIVNVRSFLCLGPASLTAACALGPLTARPLEGAAGTAVATPAFSFADDTFAFANDIRARHPDVDGLYANYCFVLARALRQFN